MMRGLLKKLFFIFISMFFVNSSSYALEKIGIITVEKALPFAIRQSAILYDKGEYDHDDHDRRTDPPGDGE